MKKQLLELEHEDEKHTSVPDHKPYRPPQLFYIGKALDLVQGRNFGKHNDGYSGYYWER